MRVFCLSGGEVVKWREDYFCMEYTRSQRITFFCTALIIGVAGFFLVKESHNGLSSQAEKITQEEAAGLSQSKSFVFTIGTSLEGRALDVFSVGTGPAKVFFIGGLHTTPQDNTPNTHTHKTNYL